MLQYNSLSKNYTTEHLWEDVIRRSLQKWQFENI